MGKSDTGGASHMLFRDRRDAGRCLAARLVSHRDEHPIVLALPRGGVVVGYEVARALDAPLDVIVARKLGSPNYPEFGIGAIAEGDARVVDEKTVRALGISETEIERVEAQERAELERRIRRYRGDRPPPDLRNRTVIVVDDGLATGVTARAAIEGIRSQRPRRLILAIPVCAQETADVLRTIVDEVLCVAAPAEFLAVGAWYTNFEQTSDEEVQALLERRRQEIEAASGQVGSGRTRIGA
jgi:predicted phosphoribosyltransferase